MPKGRHLKPEFFTDKHIVSMSALARLLYQGLWCYAADCGHLDDEPIELKMRILPADNCDVEDLLGELVEHGRIVRSKGVIEVPKLTDHARIDKRYETVCDACKTLREHDVKGAPKPPNHAVTTKGTRSDHAVTTRADPPDHAGDGDGDGDGDGLVKGAPASGKRKRPAHPMPSDWMPSAEHRAYCAEHGVNCDTEAQKFRSHAEANDRRLVVWNAGFSQWLGNARPSQTLPPRNLPRPHELEQPPDGLSPAEYAAWERESRERRKRA